MWPEQRRDPGPRTQAPTKLSHVSNPTLHHHEQSSQIELVRDATVMEEEQKILALHSSHNHSATKMTKESKPLRRALGTNLHEVIHQATKASSAFGGSTNAWRWSHAPPAERPPPADGSKAPRTA
jgi:hypothetical protein